MEFTLLGTILAKQSFRFTRTGIKYQDKDIKNWQAQARAQLIQQLPAGFKPFTGAVRIEYLDIIFPMQKAMSKLLQNRIRQGEIIYRSKKPDVDNCIKGFLDSCKTILFIDDNQVAEINNFRKRYGETPMIKFSIQEIPDGDFN